MSHRSTRIPHVDADPDVSWWGVVLALSSIVLIFAAVMWLSSIVGCTAETKGGTSEQKQQGVVVTVDRPDGGKVQITDTSKIDATTQPSAKITNIAATPNVGAPAGLGELGGISFDQIKVPAGLKTSWPLVLILAGLGFALFFLLGQRLAAIGVWGAAALGIAAPAYLVYVLALVVAYVVWTFRNVLQQLVVGNRNAIAALASDDARDAKQQMERAHDETTKRAIAAVKPR